MLEYSRIDTLATPFEPMNSREIFDDATSLLSASISETNARVTCDDLPIIMGERSQLMQLLANLIGNALKYRSADTPCIHVSAQPDHNGWKFAVRDNGIGIAPEHQEQIFEMFQRLHSQREYPGTGIGLAVCRRVVHRHGGTIGVESTPGQGSIFYFTIHQENSASP